MKTILVIDDENDLRMMMVETLQILGFDTLEAADGSTGIKVATERKPNLILCDLNMPSIDGLETLRTLRAGAATASIPFILLSGFVDSATRAKAERAGANDLMTKPFAAAELVETLNRRIKEAEEGGVLAVAAERKGQT